MYNISLLNNTSDFILVYVNGELHKLESGESLDYCNSEKHPLIITGSFFYEVKTDFKILGVYNLDTVLEIEKSGNILIRDLM